MQDGLLSSPESRSQGGGGLLAPAVLPGSGAAGNSGTWEAPLHIPGPRLSLLHSCELPGLAGLTGPPQPWQGGSAISEEGRGSLAERREGTCTLINDAALTPETTG